MSHCDYRSNWDYLQDELRRVELLLQERHRHFKDYTSSEQEQLFRGLYITENEFQDLMSAQDKTPRSRAQKEPGQSVATLFAEISAQIEHRKAQYEKANPCLPLTILAGRFELDTLDQLIILIALAPEIDLRYERLYAYLQDDVTKKRPTAQFVTDLLSPLADRPALLARLASSQSRLLRYRLLDLNENPSLPMHAYIGRFLLLPDRIRRFLLFAEKDLDADMRWMDIGTADARKGLFLPDPIRRRAQKFLQGNAQASPRLFLLCGDQEWGQEEFAQFMSAGMGLQLLVIAEVEKRLKNFLEQKWALILREAHLQEACLYIDLTCPEPQLKDHLGLKALLARLAGFPHPAFLRIERWSPVFFAAGGLPVIPITFSAADFAGHRNMWSELFEPHFPELSDRLSWLAAKFRFTPRQIQGAARALQGLLHWDPDSRRGNDLQLKVLSACRWQADHHLGKLARKIRPLYSWDELILPADRKLRLREICDIYRYRPVVYGEWGFARHLSSGKGLVALFCGPSGTGKTMAAEIIAKELDLELYKINISSLVSKYVGETEKNMERAFREAEKTDALLFFDEAESLFGRRSEIKDAHDRYANVEVSYLLQRIEEYQGMVVLASNLKKNMDEAFVRRMNIVVDFPFPEEEDRYRLWKRAFPADAPVDAGLDLAHMARKYKLSGGNISNIALRAAFLAAADGRRVRMAHLLWATRREFQNMGKLIVEADFHDHTKAAEVKTTLHTGEGR